MKISFKKMVIVVQWLQNCSIPYKSAPLPSQFKTLSRQALKQVGQTYKFGSSGFGSGSCPIFW